MQSVALALYPTAQATTHSRSADHRRLNVWAQSSTFSGPLADVAAFVNIYIYDII